MFYTNAAYGTWFNIISMCFVFYVLLGFNYITNGVIMKYSIIAILFVLITISSCSERKVISKSKMTNILLEMHIADAMRNRGDIFNINPAYRRTDSVAIYGPIFEKYGYNIDDFNHSVNYYAGKPQVMKEMYVEVISRLKNMRDEYALASEQERIDLNLWKGADSLSVNTDSVYTKFDFQLPTKGCGIYIITTDMNIENIDSIYNPQMVAWFTTAEDGDTVVGKKEFKIRNLKNFKTSLRLYLSDTSMTYLKGHFIDYDSIKAGSKQQMGIKDIYIEYVAGEGIDPTQPQLNTSALLKKDSLKSDSTKRLLPPPSKRRSDNIKKLELSQ